MVMRRKRGEHMKMQCELVAAGGAGAGAGAGRAYACGGAHENARNTRRGQQVAAGSPKPGPGATAG